MGRTLRVALVSLLALALLLQNTRTVQAVGSITVTPSSGPWGTTINIAGTGFNAGDAVTVNYDTVQIASLPAAGASWTTSYTIPFTTAYTSHNIVATGSVSGVAPTATFTVMAPAISLSRTTGPVGTSITVNGIGFGAAESGITVTYDTTTEASSVAINTPSTGGWSASFTVPASASGAHSVKASGASTPLQTVNFVVTPSISIGQNTGASGSSTTVKGNGFGASETGITVTFDGTPVGAAATADATGSWSTTFTTPASAGGSHTIGASGSTTSASSVTTVPFVVSASISANPTSGAPGTSLTVNGSAFSSGEMGITVTYDGPPISSGISANTQGAWTTTFLIPPSPSGAHSIRAYGTSTAMGSVREVSFLVQGGIQLSRTSGAPGNSITVKGGGFSGGETGITVTFDGTPVQSGITADSLGSWSANFTIPPSASGSHPVKASGTITSAASVVTFNVQGGIILTRTSGSPGNSIAVSGSGFGPNETGISLSFDNSPTVSGISANDQGAWSANLVVPQAPSGPHIVKASGPSTQGAGGAAFNVVPGISLSRATGAPGISITVNGAGFASSEGGINVTYDGATVSVGVSANVLGSWSAAFTVPPSTAGPHSITATGSVTQSGAEARFSVGPTIVLSRSTTSSGSSMTVNGSGFSSAESDIAVTYDGTPKASGISASAQGSWTVTFAIPPSTSGTHTVRASGAATQTNAPEVSLTIVPALSLTRTSVSPGVAITVNGSGFGAGENNITVNYDNVAIGSGITADQQGTWNTTFTVPPSTSGTHTITASGSATQGSNAPQASISIIPTLALSRSGTSPGSPITVNGSGFGPGETGISVTYDNQSVASGIFASAQGSWTATFPVPQSASGSHSIRASGSTTQAAIAPEVPLSVGASVSLGRSSGGPGTSINVTGSGFASGETGIALTYDGTPVVSSILASAQGSWSTSFVVPPSVAGQHGIKAGGSVNQASNVSEVSFTVTPTISLEPDAGHVSSTVNIAGAGFAATNPVKFVYDDAQISSNGTSTDAAGSFAKSFSVPKSKAGAHTVKVDDGQRNEAKATFTMDSTPPPVPRLLSPGNSGTVGITGNITPTLKWTDVSDPSGVTYVLQISTTPDFNSPVLVKTDLTSASYTLTSDEALPRGVYYWKVEAVDGASNQSGWSQPWALKSGLMPLWAFLTIIVVVVAALGGSGYFIWNRRRRLAPEAAAPEAVPVPPVIQAYWRELEPEQQRPAKLEAPKRKALPAPSKAAKTLPPELHARIKILADFAESLPLVEPSYGVEWLVELMENTRGESPSAEDYEQLLQGQMVLSYQPTWTSHPLYMELRQSFEGQPVLQDIDIYVDSVSRCVSEGTSLLQQIYRDTSTEAPADLVARGGWAFVGSIYADALGWFRGKALREPSERDYVTKVKGDDAEREVWLHGADSSPFAGPLIRADDEENAEGLRSLHLKLRRGYRGNDRVKQLVATITQLQVQRSRLIGALGEFGRFLEAS